MPYVQKCRAIWQYFQFVLVSTHLMSIQPCWYKFTWRLASWNSIRSFYLVYFIVEYICIYTCTNNTYIHHLAKGMFQSNVCFHFFRIALVPKLYLQRATTYSLTIFLSSFPLPFTKVVSTYGWFIIFEFNFSVENTNQANER